MALLRSIKHKGHWALLGVSAILLISAINLVNVRVGNLQITKNIAEAQGNNCPDPENPGNDKVRKYTTCWSATKYEMINAERWTVRGRGENAEKIELIDQERVFNQVAGWQVRGKISDNTTINEDWIATRFSRDTNCFPRNNSLDTEENNDGQQINGNFSIQNITENSPDVSTVVLEGKGGADSDNFLYPAGGTVICYRRGGKIRGAMRSVITEWQVKGTITKP